jgi:hypothetical protein
LARQNSGDKLHDNVNILNATYQYT